MPALVELVGNDVSHDACYYTPSIPGIFAGGGGANIFALMVFVPEVAVSFKGLGGGLLWPAVLLDNQSV